MYVCVYKLLIKMCYYTHEQRPDTQIYLCKYQTKTQQNKTNKQNQQQNINKINDKQQSNSVVKNNNNNYQTNNAIMFNNT